MGENAPSPSTPILCKPGSPITSLGRRWLNALLALLFLFTLGGPQPALAETPSCQAPLGWWESAGLNPLFVKQAPKVDCDFQQWSWTAFIHYMQKEGPDGQPLFLSLPTAQDLETPSAANNGSSDGTVPSELMLMPRVQKPGLARLLRNPNDLNSINQAGSEGILVDQNSRVVYYSIHVNKPYFDFAKKHMGNENYNKTPARENFPLDATVIKASWEIIDDDSKVPADTFTTKATIQELEVDPDHKGKLRPSDKTQSGVTVALIGAHVVGVVRDHPEFIWATFEQKNNAPDLPPGTPPGSKQAVSKNSFSLYRANTSAGNSNQLPTAYTLNAETQKVQPNTTIFRQFAHGGAEFSAESPTTSGMSRVADIDSINANMQGAIPEHGDKIDPVFANYNLIGSVWLDTSQTPLQPGMDLFANSVGSIALANATMESFVQGIGTNCFSCHTTQPFAVTTNFQDKNIAISHIISGSLTPSKVETAG